MRNLTLRSALLVLAALLLNSCGSNPSGLSISITDAPVDAALSVNVAVVEIDLVNASGVVSQTINFDPPRSVDLFALQGGLTSALTANLAVAPGSYTGFNVTLATDPLSAESNIVLPDGIHVLYVPAGTPSTSNLQVNFSVATDSTTNLTIDFDLRKSIIQDPNDPTKYQLVPSMRAVVDEQSGSITGSVNSTRISSVPGCIQGMAVYAYQGSSVQPTDVNFTLPANTQPYATALVGLNSTSGQYNFTLAFLPPGPYTLAFTCQANEDIANQTDAIVFSSVTNTSVAANQTTFVALP